MPEGVTSAFVTGGGSADVIVVGYEDALVEALESCNVLYIMRG